ncbi:YfcE family phosphodiesterase [Alkalihalophilus pseudofirmus]|uniref:metallophosphoesterase family protein n=1 Tax=Alkalihalobacterium alkalinitrilicum TaxID=427920 RepID=UPI00094D42E2|nr:metallophosphoesterase family protein [Alkalihalobacterium alkalinitrilicum]OLO39068.1 YfcE family phosphodiesterase [Alkalihalophilus pseudofirmus]
MKYAFLSDIHGNAVALESVLHDIQMQDVDEIFVLGDLCYRGPEPKRALQLVQALNAKVIKGNADEWVVRGINEGEVPDHLLEMMNKERDWCISQLDDQDISYLEQLPTDLEITLPNGTNIYAFHATPTSLFDVVLPDTDTSILSEKLITSTNANLYIYAHIHLPYVRYFNSKCIANLGSVGLPFDGQPLSSYVIVEEKGDQFSVAIQRVPYDTKTVIAQYEKIDYPNLDVMKTVIQDGTSPFGK